MRRVVGPAAVAIALAAVCSGPALAIFYTFMAPFAGFVLGLVSQIGKTSGAPTAG